MIFILKGLAKEVLISHAINVVGDENMGNYAFLTIRKISGRNVDITGNSKAQDGTGDYPSMPTRNFSLEAFSPGQQITGVGNYLRPDYIQQSEPTRQFFKSAQPMSIMLPSTKAVKRFNSK